MSEEKKEPQSDKPVRIIDMTKRIALIATKDAPHHEEGEKFTAGEIVAELMIKNKWAVKDKSEE